MNILTEKIPLAKPWNRKEELKAEFERVALPNLSDLYRAAFYLAKDETEAEDLVQETYLRAFSFFDKFQPGTNCKAWMLTILRNLFINRYRQKAREPELFDWEQNNNGYHSSLEHREKGSKSDPESLLSSKLNLQKIGAALKELPEEFQSAIILVDIEELSYEEAGKVMGCPIGTVRSRVFRGRQILRVALRDYALQSGLLQE
jgi:RNA polymerase sigma-70 factor (ECF subfamily)